MCVVNLFSWCVDEVLCAGVWIVFVLRCVYACGVDCACAFCLWFTVWCYMSCACVFVVCACVCSVCLYDVIVNSCVMKHAELCGVVCIICLSCSCVVSDVVCLSGLVLSLWFCVCIVLLCVSVMVVICVCLWSNV